MQALLKVGRIAPVVSAALVGAVLYGCSEVTSPAQAQGPETPTPVSSEQKDGCTNEPAGYTRINEQDWDVSPIRRVQTSQGWVDDAGNGSTNLKIVQDPTSPFPSPNHNVVDGLFSGGSPGGSGPFDTYLAFDAQHQFKNLYICLYLKHDANFDNTNGNVGTKFLWPAGDQVQGGYTYMSHDGQNMEFVFRQQGAVDRGIFTNMNSPAAILTPKRGQWVKYEILLKANTNNSTANGGLDVWIDGVQTHHYTDMNWQMAPARTWLSLTWNPTYGGGTNPVPHDQHQYMDHIRISGSNQ